MRLGIVTNKVWKQPEPGLTAAELGRYEYGPQVYVLFHQFNAEGTRALVEHSNGSLELVPIEELTLLQEEST